jgi:hypothetical protein
VSVSADGCYHSLIVECSTCVCVEGVYFAAAAQWVGGGLSSAASGYGEDARAADIRVFFYITL